MNPICPYCEQESVLDDGMKVYRTTRYGFMYVCRDYPECDAYVGCHMGTKEPLGRLANKLLRELKREAHLVFDPFWTVLVQKQGWKKHNARKTMYRWLASELGIPEEKCHIGMFDPEQCIKVIEVCRRSG